MLIEDALYNEDSLPPVRPGDWGDSVVRRTSFDALELEGLIFDGVLENCAFTSIEFYWGLFNVALIAGTRFESCRFRSTSFRSCTLVDCEFVDCAFELDNLGSDCTIDDCLIAATRFVGCTWIKKAGEKKRDITRTRWIGCTQDKCDGFDGMF